ncbi:ribosomal protection-like ABC-F family protein [Clostridium aciditolerans]|uniref:ABC-F family ATP-binding cassette domain-containing protein n=1 Tax=Clostridium aciditolerans TaxID=339861 RepID=A0A934HWA6_9CLOT|nr:ABC-F family ATP-binding cassette domain-containing protein [Clostridium aciditolerans]MBI6872122.1 ABC-F family ATP-binding cassette domain-containing protein [Clostridium aciditolerans]
MIALALNNIKKYYGGTQIIDNMSFEVHEGEKVGIVGKNGCGKSTILKLIMGLEAEYSGNIIIKKDSKLGYVDQLPSYNEDFKVIDVLNLAFNTENEILKNMKKLEDIMENIKEDELDKILKNYNDLQQSYEQIGGYETDERLSKICIGLNITEDFKQRNFSTLSGGEKTTVLLAKVLLQKSDILLLDEPSNHLDLKSIEWLEDFLKNYKGAVLIVSHDRYFLDRVVTKIIEVENMKSKTYLGGYSQYLEQKEKDIELQLAEYNVQQKRINAMEKSIKDLRDWGMKGDNEKFFKRAENIRKRLEKIERVDKPKLENRSMNLNINTGQRSGKDVIKLEDGIKSFKSKIILKDANLHFRYGEKLALIGNNGCGKSTLLKLLLKVLNPQEESEDYILDSGKVQIGTSLEIGYLPQNVVFSNEEFSILECFREDIELPEGKAREYLAKFLFFGENVFKKVKNLSGGERSRLLLSKLMFRKVNTLILDEPTNHLDIVSREVLEDTLKEFKGSILFVSHDRYFINAICSRIVELKDGVLTSYEGNYEYYKLKSNTEPKNEKLTVKKNEDRKIYNKKIKNKETTNEKKAAVIEKRIQELESKINLIEKEMGSCNEYSRLNELHILKEDINLEIEDLMEQWVQIS